MRLLQNETEKALNELLALTFQGNSQADNCAYNLASLTMLQSEKIFHEKYAHIFPEWADLISECMLTLGGIPVRKGLQENIHKYTDIALIFTSIHDFLLSYRNKIYEIIEIADMNNDREVVIFLDDLLTIILPYLKQTNIWLTKANKMKDNTEKFDDEFEDFTFI